MKIRSILLIDRFVGLSVAIALLLTGLFLDARAETPQRMRSVAFASPASARVVIRYDPVRSAVSDRLLDEIRVAIVEGRQVTSYAGELSLDMRFEERIPSSNPRAVPDRAAAMYDGVAVSVLWPSSALTEREQWIDLRRSIRHEVMHLLLNGASNGRVPLWFDEGVALLFAKEDVESYLDALRQRGSVLRLRSFASASSLADMAPEDMRAFYGYSVVAVSVALGPSCSGDLPGFLSALSRGVRANQVYRQFFLPDFNDFLVAPGSWIPADRWQDGAEGLLDLERCH